MKCIRRLDKRSGRVEGAVVDTMATCHIDVLHYAESANA